MVAYSEVGCKSEELALLTRRLKRKGARGECRQNRGVEGLQRVGGTELSHTPSAGSEHSQKGSRCRHGRMQWIGVSTRASVSRERWCGATVDHTYLVPWQVLWQVIGALGTVAGVASGTDGRGSVSRTEVGGAHSTSSWHSQWRRARRASGYARVPSSRMPRRRSARDDRRDDAHAVGWG